MLRIPAVFLSILLLTGCLGGSESAVSSGSPAPAPAPEGSVSVPAPEPSGSETATDKEETNVLNMTITIGGTQFPVTLEQNDTTAALSALLPLELNMQELNGNEKYGTLPQALPTDVFSPGQIQTGDVMLYGDDCLVVFYKDFPTSYRYTRIGHVEDAAGLAAAVGSGSVTMTFSG